MLHILLLQVTSIIHDITSILVNAWKLLKACDRNSSPLRMLHSLGCLLPTSIFNC